MKAILIGILYIFLAMVMYDLKEINEKQRNEIGILRGEIGMLNKKILAVQYNFEKQIKCGIHKYDSTQVLYKSYQSHGD
jgi:hypothetical protein